MLTMALVTIGFLPFYLLVRHPFRKLPLHIDTGFYVSNNTVSTRRLRFSRGWNARFAGCSKVAPEFFYSLVYLWSTRGGSRPTVYKTRSRLFASIYNYVTAIAVGTLAWQFSGESTLYYCAGLITFGLLSSEAQYGVYFENAELLGILWNVIAISLLYEGLQNENALFICLGAFVWACEAFFVKLSSGVALAVVVVATAVAWPGGVPALSLGCLVPALLYGVWVIYNGRRPAELISAMLGHELAVGQRNDRSVIFLRLAEKIRCFARTVRRQPVIPALALAGLLIHPPGSMLIGSWFLGVAIAYVLQAAGCWYYQIPLLPLVALLAVPAVVALLLAGPIGILALAGVAIIWLAHNTMRVFRMDPASLNRWCWRGYHPEPLVHANLQLEEFVTQIRSTVTGKPLLIYGPFNQAYVQLGASYDTPIVAPEYYMDDMCEGWQRELARQLVSSPAAFVLDTSDSFASAATRDRLGLDYRLTHACADRFRLFKLSGVDATRENVDSVQTFQPQSRAELASERISGQPDVSPAAPADDRHPGWDQESEESQALERILNSLSEDGHQRIAVYGAGQFTVRNRHVYEKFGAAIVVVLDDNPNRHGSTFLSWPLRRPEEAEDFAIDAVIISTDRFAGILSARAERLWGTQVTVAGLDAVVERSAP